MSTLRCAALLLAASGCFGPDGTPDHGTPHLCTLIGGEDGLYVRVDVNGGKLPPGDYTFVARVGDVEVTADGTMTPEGAFMNRGGEGIVDGKHLSLGGALYADFGRIEVHLLEGPGPEMVTLGVRHDGAMLGEQDYAPKYSAVYPNGEDCGPELHQAHGSLVVAAP